MGVYAALTASNSNGRLNNTLHACPEAPALAGFTCGNTPHPGCLTNDESVRLHSCEKGNFCATIQTSPVVWIRPIIAHLPNGSDISEMGVGGGGADLEQEAELDILMPEELGGLLQV